MLLGLRGVGKTVLLNQFERMAAEEHKFLTRHWRPGAAGAMRLGVVHGAYCVGCCWVLMALLFVGGVMNLIWVAALAVLVLAEKFAARGEWLGRSVGVALIAWGVATTLV